VGDAVHGTARDRGEDRPQQRCERGFGEVPGEQRGDRDAELGAGQLERELPQRPADRTCRPVPRLGVPADLGPVDGDERELGRDEERVAGGQQDEGNQRKQCRQEQVVDGLITSRPIVPDAAQRDGRHG